MKDYIEAVLFMALMFGGGYAALNIVYMILTR